MKMSLSGMTRREFAASAMTALGITSISVSAKPMGRSLQGLTVKQVIDIILKEIPGVPIDKTVDTLKAGRPDAEVTGVVTTMFATIEVIRKAIDLKANFIITHEPTFYNHLDDTTWLEGDKVYTFKRALLEKNNIAVWRFHDYWHSHRPDGVLMGVLTKLGWQQYYNEASPGVLTLPPASLGDIVTLAKNKLGIKNLRMVGDPEQVCKRVLLMPGASGGRSQIQRLKAVEPDVLICGEVAEWETSEYIRDARAMGLQRSLIVLGHAQSEEPGMQWMVSWLQPKLPAIKITHIPANNPFIWS